MFELGGVATRADLVRLSSRADVDRALRTGELATGGRGRYRLPDADHAVAAAHAVGGTLALTSAAIHHGWEVKHVPERPHVVVPRGRHLRLHEMPDVRLHRRDLHPSEIEGAATDALTTLEMCARLLPFDEALAVADSYLRHGGAPAALRGIAHSARGHGAAKIRRVTAHADGDAANPFESVLRAIALDVPGLHVQPQRIISGPLVWARPDLVDRDLRLVLEADSFRWHGDRRGLVHDAARYNRLLAAGFEVMRFTWEKVMFEADETRMLIAAVVQRLSQPRPRRRKAA